MSVPHPRGQVERAGAAQGLAEVLSALGESKLTDVLPEVIEGCGSSSADAREGFSMMWTHLPAILGKRFEPYLEEVLPVLLEGLADDASPVRETCFKGALAIINTYLESAAALLLPPLQRGLADDNYRIRQSSSELLGSLMARLTGGEYMEVVELGEEVPEDSPLATIPIEQQHALLAAVYIARNDTQPGVRSAASAVWKSLIANAPKALRIILRALTDQLIEGLSTDDEDTQAGAAQALGEVRALDPSTCCCSLLQPACPRSPNAPSCLPPLTQCSSLHAPAHPMH